MANQSQTAKKQQKPRRGDASAQIIANQPNPSWLIGGKEALEMAREDGLIPDENGKRPGEFFEPIGGYLKETMGWETPDLPPLKKRGRPQKADSLTNAERQARFRAKRLQAETGERIAATIKRLATEFNLTESEVTRHLLRFALCNRNWRQTGFPTTKV